MSRDSYFVQRLAHSAPGVDSTGQYRLIEFIRTKFPEVDIQRVESVKNKFLYAAFRIRKAQLALSLPASTEELIHATSALNVAPILKSNLDWRKVKRTKYGKGSSFSKDAQYANKYCNNKNGPNRAFIIFDVLVGKTRPVKPNNDSVPYGYCVDTYRSVDKKVIVKFDDFTFYPKFVIYYSSQPQIYNAPRAITSVEKNVPSYYKTVYGSSPANVTSKSSYNSTNAGLRTSNPIQRISVATETSSAGFVRSSISSSNSVNGGLRLSNVGRPCASGLSSYSTNRSFSASNLQRSIPAATVRYSAPQQRDCTIL